MEKFREHEPQSLRMLRLNYNDLEYIEAKVGPLLQDSLAPKYKELWCFDTWISLTIVAGVLLLRFEQEAPSGMN